MTTEVKRFDELGGECNCVDEVTETEEGIIRDQFVVIVRFVVNQSFVMEGERCE